MKYEYRVEEENFLNFQLYHMSQSDQFRLKVKRQPIFIMITNLAVALFFAAGKNYGISILFVIIGVLWYFLYPIRMKRIHEQRMKEEIKAKFQNHFGAEAAFEVNDSTLRTSDKGGYSDKNYTDVLKIVHLPSETLIIFKNHQTFILPKATTANYDAMKQELNAKAKSLHLKIEDLPTWKW
jgi:hypothetical protein